MIPAGKSLIRTAELAVELEVSPDTVTKWGRTRLAFARWSRGRFLVQRLRDAGILPRLETAEALPIARSA